MSNKIKVDLGNNSYNISLIEGFKNSVEKFGGDSIKQLKKHIESSGKY